MTFFPVQYCLNCHSETTRMFSWGDLLFDRKATYLCARCDENLMRISGETCSVCSRELVRLASEYVADGICLDCIKWRQSKYCFLDGNTSLFHYNQFLKEVIARIKYRGDYELLKIFTPYLQKMVYDAVIPIPLSDERHLERGFNQAEAIGVIAGYPLVFALHRVHSEKQAKKDRLTRLKGEQVFRANTIDLTGKSVLLLDDIYTTGRTLQYAAQVLKEECGADVVDSFTLIRG